jgi:hypothetical protein
MATARFQFPDGRIGRFEVPDGTSPEQAQILIEQAVSEMGVQPPAAAAPAQTTVAAPAEGAAQPPQPVAEAIPVNLTDTVGTPAAPQAPAEATPEVPQEDRGVLGMVGDVGRGLVEAVTGSGRETETIMALPEWTSMPELNSATFRSALTGLGTLLANPDEITQVVQANFPDTQVFQDEKGNYIFRSSLDGRDYAIKPGMRVSDVPRIIGGLAAFTPAGRATTIAGAGGRSALTQTGIEGTQAAAGGEFSPTEVAMAGATGAAFPAAQQVLRAGRTAIQKPPLPEVVGTGQREGIRLMTTDVLPPQTFTGKIVQATGERIPLAGTGGVRAAQQQERVDAVRNLLKDYDAADYAKLSDDVLADLKQVKSAEIKKFTTLKSEVINRLSDKGNVPIPKALKALDDQIAELTNRRTPAADEAIERLREIRNTLPDRNLFQLEAYRADELAKVFMDDARPMSAAAKDIGEKAVRKIYDPVRQDMINFIKQNGERRDVDKFMVANARLSEGAKDVRNAALKRVLTTGDVKPEVMQDLLFKGKPSEVRALYARLSPEGKANARSAVLAKAGADATRDIGIDTVISPTIFANNVKKMGDSVGVLFTGADLKRIEGLTRVLNLTRRAGDAAAAPPTGVQATPFLIGSLLTDIFAGSGGVSALKAAATASGVGLIARSYESAPVRNLLLRMANTKPGSPLEAQIFRQLQTLTQTERQLADEQE